MIFVAASLATCLTLARTFPQRNNWLAILMFKPPPVTNRRGEVPKRGAIAACTRDWFASKVRSVAEVQLGKSTVV
jgi:hypothetical protein